MAERFIGCETIYGVDGEHRSPYMTRLWLGHLRLHVFHRGDADPDCHDHPWPFWTFPLTSYVEEVLDASTGERSQRLVGALWMHRRAAEFAHRVIGRWAGRPSLDAVSGRLHVSQGKIVTIVWRGRGARAWGFWRIRPGEKCWVPWRRYVFEGGKHAPCEPGEGADVAR